MSERQKLLDAARSAINVLDAAQSAVDLLNAVLEKEEQNGCHGSLSEHGEQQCVVVMAGETQNNVSKSTSEVQERQASEGRTQFGGPSAMEVKGDMKLHHQNTAPLKMPRAASVTIATDDGEKGENDSHAQMKYEKNESERRFIRTVNQRIPSQVAKVTPQRPIGFGKHDDVVGDSTGNGGGTECRNEGWDHGLNEFVIEQAQASSILILENAKLREELQEAKNEVAALNEELSMKKQVNRKDAEVQTVGAHVFGDNFYRVPGFNDLTSDDDTDYLTTYSNSYHDKRYTPQANRSDSLTGKGGADVYFGTPASNISTPGTLGRASVSSSGGGLIRRKLELPKSLKNGGGYLSITSYEPMTSEDYESSMTSPGCCPFACFGRLHGRKVARN